MKGHIFQNRMKGQIFKNKEGKRRRGIHLIPNILTTGNLFSGLASVVLVSWSPGSSGDCDLDCDGV